MIRTEAWVLHRGKGDGEPGLFHREEFAFPEPAGDEVLALPLFGCWEGNMEHAMRRLPVDICEVRGEDRIVVGNAGVVRVAQVGPDVKHLREGDVCLVFCNGTPDEHGYPEKIYGYDDPGSIGVMARMTKLKERQLIPVPKDSRYTLPQWAAFSLRYITAWANWKLALACWRAQLPEVPLEKVQVLAWGGGVSLAELTLAQNDGCQVTMAASTPARLKKLQDLGMKTIDRAALQGPTFEKQFLAEVARLTSGHGADIFVDQVGANFKTTLKALARQGVITTSGWKSNALYPVVRAMECIGRHLHVFTHYARYAEGVAAVEYAARTGWLPTLESPTYAWDDVPKLAADYAEGRVDDYFPTFAINP